MSQKKIRIAINGFGRIGRVFFRQAFNNPNFDIVAINDLGSKENLLYLLKHDSVYGIFEPELGAIEFLSENDPSRLPWKKLDVDIVVESTGAFTTFEKSKAHLDAGAKRVVITAPAKDDVTPTATPNIGFKDIGEGRITSNASCTTNATTPIVAIMMETLGVEKAVLSTIHGYTASQTLVDSPSSKDFRRGRAAAESFVPSETGAAIATEKAIPAIAGKFDGVAIRVPVITGSLADFTFVAKRKTSVEEVNRIFKDAEKKKDWQGILKTTDEPIVSRDIVGEPYGAIIDLNMTRVVDGDLVKVFSWYDNEWGYAAMLAKHIETLAPYL
ncbi:MAG: type I glyceraldehyde-3-phosphate dehydrogenase [Candidatus Lloydbacteria bacterium CG22_combo_CG10-13_8_21_14_all_47_15]|uniref:Type I glyceraldehyde-3-phosphate dehydrogenase n=1 Tax=Candidatus Lloydbacteria bacterium CG22_combo_CG10-13_8_21_14_all_47_15 TaxID=1974635 RepID=A0A2H0CXA8_9BACT|nr:MAG: type I glyceraldehyde-3-phosphate dehydrogenase [Candidatus Lloydbacteria bacterium CG22_combo_CG10-13_8_21_14_all_47_15]